MLSRLLGHHCTGCTEILHPKVTEAVCLRGRGKMLWFGANTERLEETSDFQKPYFKKDETLEGMGCN